MLGICSWRRGPGFACTVLLTAFCFGCAPPQQLTQDSCVVQPASSFVGAGGSDGHMTVARNGTPCEAAFVMNGRRDYTGFVSDPQVVTPPAHGSASARMSNGAAFLTYTPNRDYVGSDLFRVAFSADYTLTVDVDVVPLH